MFNWKVAGTIIAGLLMVLSWQAYSLIKLENKVLTLKNSVSTYKSNELQLNASIESANSTVDRILDINSKTGDLLADLSNRNYASNVMNATLNAKINELRTTEAAAALERPFERGTAAGTRINNLMNAISGNDTEVNSVNNSRAVTGAATFIGNSVATRDIIVDNSNVSLPYSETKTTDSKLMTQKDIEEFIKTSISKQTLTPNEVN